MAHRSIEQESLGEVTSSLPQIISLGGGLNPLRHHVKSQHVGHLEDGVDKKWPPVRQVDVVHESLVDLQLVEWEVAQAG